ncbi:hypothetical protein AG1IA_09140 [Rhizoctonia solani AG-1 IA]|uniref:Uncharacterized protein n=1 Tax=Thanatephorus cucumeris (strain AG1-IA) TaxID=983506 RepID=L8WFV9_THACA|nr:hypothetical protein AG1IA_09140 [Rhizoctonia solani AG-1 IA]
MASASAAKNPTSGDPLPKNTKSSPARKRGNFGTRSVLEISGLDAKVKYITTLESHIADRDQLIAAIRSELSNTHNENTELRREIDALKVCPLVSSTFPC